MEQSILDVLEPFEMVDEEDIGYINTNEEVNQKVREYIQQIQHYMECKKLKSCILFLNSILHQFQNEPFESLIFRTIKIYCSLRLYDLRTVSAELGSLDKLEGTNRYDFKNYASKYKKTKGNMIPFLLKLIHCYYPYFLKLHFTVFDRLYILIKNYEHLLNVCIKQIEDPTVKNKDVFLKKKNKFFRYVRVATYTLCDLLVEKTYIPQAIELLQNKILQYDPHHSSTLSLMGKFCLLMGSFESAQNNFHLVESLSECDHNHVKMNRSFLNIFLEEYKIALDEVLTIDSKNVSEYDVYCNNASVLHFYNCEINKAIEILEQAITENYVNAFPSSIKNLNYYYELSKRDPDTVKRINSYIRKSLNEDSEIMSLTPGERQK